MRSEAGVLERKTHTSGRDLVRPFSRGNARRGGVGSSRLKYSACQFVR